jgi:hypothetical protein
MTAWKVDDAMTKAVVSVWPAASYPAGTGLRAPTEEKSCRR